MPFISPSVPVVVSLCNQLLSLVVALFFQALAFIWRHQLSYHSVSLFKSLSIFQVSVQGHFHLADFPGLHGQVTGFPASSHQLYAFTFFLGSQFLGDSLGK
ncbi:hypothetical protein AMTRI_Chr03g146240 [Amborella trichopoda]